MLQMFFSAFMIGNMWLYSCIWAADRTYDYECNFLNVYHVWSLEMFTALEVR